VLAVALAAAFGCAHAQSIQTLDPVVVTASKVEEPQGQATVLVDVIARQEIDESGAANIIELLDRLPGLNVARQYGRMGLDSAVDVGYLGGSSHHRTLIMVDSVRLNDIDDGTVIFGSVPLSSIERLEVRRAGGGVLFGDRALGGVVNIITKPQADNSAVAEATIGSFGLKSFSGSISREMGEGSAQIDISRSIQDGFRRDSSQAQTGISARFSAPTQVGVLGVTMRGSDENARLPQSISASTFQTDPRNPGSYRTSSWRQTRAGVLSLESAYGESWSSSLRFASEDIDRRSIDIYSSNVYETTRNTLYADFARQVKGNTSLLGAEVFDAQSQSNRLNRNRVDQKSTAVYASTEQAFASTKVMAGIRSQEMVNEFSPSAGAVTQASRKRLSSWSLSVRQPFSGGVLRGGLQTSFAFPTADQLYTFSSASPYAPQNIYPGVEPMTSREAQLGWVRRTETSMSEISARRIFVSDEIGFKLDCDGSDDCNDNLYDTLRTVLTLRHQRSPWTGGYLDASADFINAAIETGSNAGRQLPMTPSRVFKVGLLQKGSFGRVSFQAHYRAPMVQSTDDSHSYPKIPGRTVYDLGWFDDMHAGIRVSVWVRNLTDKKYYDFAQYGSVAPADGRSIEASLQYRF